MSDANEPVIQFCEDAQEEKSIVPAGQETRLSKTQDMNSSDIKEKVQAIQQVMNDIMKTDVHYGIIPGCKKPTLLKPGAEVLGVMFRFAPRFIKERIDHGDGHREYIVDCELNHITGTFIGSGTGSCSTLESKYRYRNDYEKKGRVPKEYWKNRDADQWKGMITKKFDEGWFFVLKGEKIENPDIADNYNTVLKMAKKRAYVDAVLTATGASDIFTQDLEPEHGKQQDTKPQQEKPQYPPSPKGNTMPRLTADQAKKEILEMIQKDQTTHKTLDKTAAKDIVSRIEEDRPYKGGFLALHEKLKTKFEAEWPVF